ncbi:DUF4123 domain-containing protein [Massilia niastensis]|uniref:DUF4123 domain-containing protein n=1 Tax=Massilia niastensis TaxID=544911 RepID=UPI0012EC91D7|nr:DUF4123 domain-containing protein [Massilia niastensis]
MNEHLAQQIIREHAFALVDAAMVEHLPDGMHAVPLVPRRLASSAHLMPKLIDLRSTRDDHLSILSKCVRDACLNAQWPPVSLLVRTPVGAPEFARYWNSMQLASPEPKCHSWLRLHDPRVLHQLLRVLTTRQRRYWFGRSESVTYWVGGEWVTVLRDSDHPLEPRDVGHTAVPPHVGPAKWDWSRIETIGIVNRVLHGAGVQTAAALASQGELAEQLIERARAKHGLVEQADLVEFAVRGLMTNAMFDAHPVVARAIRPDTMAGEESSLSDRFALIEEQVWSALRQPDNAIRNACHDATETM